MKADKNCKLQLQTSVFSSKKKYIYIYINININPNCCRAIISNLLVEDL